MTELLIFDLDGTVIDSSEDIAWSVNGTLGELGLPTLPYDVIVSYIGWGVRMLLKQAIPEERHDLLDRGAEVFLALYSGHLTVRTRPYPGAVKLLRHFKERGVKMALVTNKPFALATEILNDLALGCYFHPVLGGDSVKQKKPHPEGLETVLRVVGVPPSRALFIGDSRVDVETGKSAGIATIGAAYGFRGREELEAAGADRIIEHLTDLKKIVE